MLVVDGQDAAACSAASCDLVREAQPIVGAPPQGDLSSVGFDGRWHRGSGWGGRRRGRRPAGSVRNERPFLAEQFSSIDEFIEAGRFLAGLPRSAGSASS